MEQACFGYLELVLEYFYEIVYSTIIIFGICIYVVKVDVLFYLMFYKFVNDFGDVFVDIFVVLFYY